mmetsp:Transcript_90073/g.278630  ORF Transcript_90073/g.278630 Transcript_90073/m.278630 type:complete len:220 (-) Transcript_90073:402-1061(-)
MTNRSGSPLSWSKNPKFPLLSFTAPLRLPEGPRGPGAEAGWLLLRPASPTSAASGSSGRTFSALGFFVFWSSATSYMTRVPTGGQTPPKAWHWMGMKNMSLSLPSGRMKPNLPEFCLTTPVQVPASSMASMLSSGRGMLGSCAGGHGDCHCGSRDSSRDGSRRGVRRGVCRGGSCHVGPGPKYASSGSTSSARGFPVFWSIATEKTTRVPKGGISPPNA